MNMSARSTQDLSIDDINDLLEDKGPKVPRVSSGLPFAAETRFAHARS